MTDTYFIIKKVLSNFQGPDYTNVFLAITKWQVIGWTHVCPKRDAHTLHIGLSQLPTYTENHRQFRYTNCGALSDLMLAYYRC